MVRYNGTCLSDCLKLWNLILPILPLEGMTKRKGSTNWLLWNNGDGMEICYTNVYLMFLFRFGHYNLRRLISHTRSSSISSFRSTLSNLKRGQQYLGALVAVVRSICYMNGRDLQWILISFLADANVFVFFNTIGAAFQIFAAFLLKLSFSAFDRATWFQSVHDDIRRVLSVRFHSSIRLQLYGVIFQIN